MESKEKALPMESKDGEMVFWRQNFKGGVSFNLALKTWHNSESSSTFILVKLANQSHLLIWLMFSLPLIAFSFSSTHFPLFIQRRWNPDSLSKPLWCFYATLFWDLYETFGVYDRKSEIFRKNCPLIAVSHQLLSSMYRVWIMFQATGPIAGSQKTC